jgi:hypothetical protein
MLGGNEPYPHLHPYNHESEVSIHSSPEAEPGVFTIRGWTGAWSANGILQTRQSLASQVTSQIVGPEINVTFRYNPKKVRRA